MTTPAHSRSSPSTWATPATATPVAPRVRMGRANSSTRVAALPSRTTSGGSIPRRLSSGHPASRNRSRATSSNAAGHGSTPRITSAIATEAISSRSASGSSSCPTRLTCPNRLASHPSTQSVDPTTAVRTSPHPYRPVPSSQAHTGISSSLSRVTAFGTVRIADETRRLGPKGPGARSGPVASGVGPSAAGEGPSAAGVGSVGAEVGSVAAEVGSVAAGVGVWTTGAGPSAAGLPSRFGGPGNGGRGSGEPGGRGSGEPGGWRSGGPGISTRSWAGCSGDRLVSLMPWSVDHRPTSRARLARRRGWEVVGTAGFEPATPSPPDWCANQAAPRPERGLESPKRASGYHGHPRRPPARSRPPSGPGRPLPGPDPDHQPHRRALEPEGAPQVPLQVAAVAGGELAAGEQDELGRVDPGLSGVTDLH